MKHHVTPPSSLPNDYSGLELDFHTLANHIPQLAWMSKPDGAMFWVNKQWLKFSGHPPEQMRDWGWANQIHSDYRARVLGEFKENLLNGEPWEDTIPLRRRDGEWCWFLTRAVPVHDKEGQVLRWFGTATDITEQRKISDRQHRLMREVDHRAQNALAVAQAIVKLSQATTIEAYRAIVENRIAALSRAHIMLADRGWQGIDLRSIINGELTPSAKASNKVTLTGEIVWVDPSFVQSIALLFNELISNAERHGALSAQDGRLMVSWTVSANDIDIRWRETGMKNLCQPAKTGFGISVIERIIRQQLNQKIIREWTTDGVNYDFTLPRHPSTAAPPCI